MAHPGSPQTDHNTDLEVVLTRTGDATLVSAHLMPGDRSASHSTTAFPPVDAERIRDRMQMGSLDTEQAREVGGALFAFVFHGAVSDVYRHAIADSHNELRIRLVLDDGALARLPWELMYDADRSNYLALEWSFVRGVSLVQEAHPLASAATVRLLIVDSFAPGHATPAGDREPGEIAAALAPLIANNMVSIDMLHNATATTLVHQLRTKAGSPSGGYHVLHLVAHGHYDSESHRGSVILRGDDDGPDHVESEAFAALVGQFDLRLVFLNTCQSATVAGSGTLDTVHSVAAALLRRGIPAVIGMQLDVVDEVAAKMAREFYAAIADHRPIDAAVADARRLLRRAGTRRDADFGIPVCYLREGETKLTDPPETRPLSHRIGVLAPLGAVVIAIVSLIVAVTRNNTSTDDADYRVGVVVDKAVNSVAFPRSDVTASVRKSLLNMNGQLLAHVDALGSYKAAASPAAIDARSRRIAGEKHYDVVLHVTVLCRTGASNIASPRVYVNPELSQFANAVEFAGAYALDEIKLRVCPAGKNNTKHLPELDAPLRLVAGIGAYNLGQWNLAIEELTKARAAFTRNPNSRVHALVELIIANATLFAAAESPTDAAIPVATLDAAEKTYRRALGGAPAQAKRGVAEIVLLREPGCSDMTVPHSDAAENRLLAAVGLLEEAATGPQPTDPETLRDTLANRSLGLARTYQCLANVTVPDDRATAYATAAVKHARDVVNKYEKEQPDLDRIETWRRAAFDGYILVAANSGCSPEDIRNVTDWLDKAAALDDALTSATPGTVDANGTPASIKPDDVAAVRGARREHCLPQRPSG